MGIKENEKRLMELDAKGLLVKDELFAVTRRGKDDWRIQPGDQMNGFVNNEFDYKHIGPNTVETVQAFHSGSYGVEPLETAPPINEKKSKKKGAE